MKTPEQIAERIEAIAEMDWLGAERADLILYLPFESARKYLKEGMTTEDWAKTTSDVKPPLEAAKEYLPFAWRKANDCRGISAGRSLDHLKAWLWLAGYDALIDAEFRDYEYYGKPQLVMASVIMGFDWRQHDDGRWANDEDSDGLSAKQLAAAIAEAEAAARKYANEQAQS